MLKKIIRIPFYKPKATLYEHDIFIKLLTFYKRLIEGIIEAFEFPCLKYKDADKLRNTPTQPTYSTFDNNSQNFKSFQQIMVHLVWMAPF